MQKQLQVKNAIKLFQVACICKLQLNIVTLQSTLVTLLYAHIALAFLHNESYRITNRTQFGDIYSFLELPLN